MIPPFPKRPCVVGLTFAALLIVGAAPASAARQYRCGGKVQYRPCDQQLHEVRSRTVPAAAAAAFARVRRTTGDPRGSLGSRFAEVTRQEYRSLRDGMGLWHGAIRGNGDIHLQLELEQPGKETEVRYMGHVPLRGNETTFNFKSLPPAGSGWRWKVTSWAK